MTCALASLSMFAAKNRVRTHLLREMTELTTSRQIAIDEQVGHLEEGGLFSELFDGISCHVVSGHER